MNMPHAFDGSTSVIILYVEESGVRKKDREVMTHTQWRPRTVSRQTEEGLWASASRGRQAPAAYVPIHMGVGCGGGDSEDTEEGTGGVRNRVGGLRPQKHRANYLWDRQAEPRSDFL